MASDNQPVAVILSSAETATTAYFLRPHLEKLGYDITRVGEESGSLVSMCDAQRWRRVVISRYMPGCGYSALRHLKNKGATLTYFMDDDLFDLAALQGLPWRYRWKVFSRAWMHRSRLLRLCDEFWVSTPSLAEKYARFHPVLLEPAPLPDRTQARPGIRICYHGTASHAREIEWLLPVMREVQARSENIHFELFGTRRVARRFGCLPRVSVLHPMSWENYLSHTALQKCDIALAPLLPGVFNAGRGPTKFYDYTRMGAVGLYTDINPYRAFIRHDVDGVLLDNDPGAWVEAILRLAEDEKKRAAMAAAARQRVLGLASENK